MYRHSFALPTARRIGSVLLVVLLAVGWWAFLRPSMLGGPLTPVTVTGQSMEPKVYTGDLAVMRDAEAYEKGDVIAFRARAVPGSSSAYVIHRVVAGSANAGYVTRGDNNGWQDPWRPTADTVAGRLWCVVPGAGSAVRWMAQPARLAALLAGLAASPTMLGGRRDETRQNRRVPRPTEQVATA